MLGRPWLPLGRGDPRPSQRLLKPHRTCWGRARGSFVSTRQEVQGKGTKCEWCHFPHGLPKDRSNPGRSPGVDTLRVAQSAPGEPQRRANLHPDLPGTWNDVSASRAHGRRAGEWRKRYWAWCPDQGAWLQAFPQRGQHSPNCWVELGRESRCQDVTRKHKLPLAGPSVYRT